MEKRTEAIGIRCSKILKDVACRFAKKKKVSVSALAEIALAEHIGCPELADLPRTMGRPKKEVSDGK